MTKSREIARIRKALQEWERDVVGPVLERWPEREEGPKTLSGREVRRLYTPVDNEGKDYLEEINFPGWLPIHARHPPDRISG